MTGLQAAPADRPRPAATERRRHQRVEVALLGRYMLANRQEHPCQTLNMSPGGALLIAPASGKMGERVVAYLEHVGRVEGVITRLVEKGFALAIAGTARRRDKLASQLTWLANRDELGLPEDRRHERVTPRNPMVMLKVESGREFPARLIDVSMSGAAISIEQAPPIGAAVTLGKTPARVVRHFAGGLAVQFRLSLSPERFDESIIL